MLSQVRLWFASYYPGVCCPIKISNQSLITCLTHVNHYLMVICWGFMFFFMDSHRFWEFIKHSKQLLVVVLVGCTGCTHGTGCTHPWLTGVDSNCGGCCGSGRLRKHMCTDAPPAAAYSPASYKPQFKHVWSRVTSHHQPKHILRLIDPFYCQTTGCRNRIKLVVVCLILQLYWNYMSTKNWDCTHSLATLLGTPVQLLGNTNC